MSLADPEVECRGNYGPAKRMEGDASPEVAGKQCRQGAGEATDRANAACQPTEGTDDDGRAGEYGTEENIGEQRRSRRATGHARDGKRRSFGPVRPGYRKAPGP